MAEYTRLMRPVAILRLISAVLAVGMLANQYACIRGGRGPSAVESTTGATASQQKDDAFARHAFLAAYPVFMHPRCMNCHPAGDPPLQGDDSRPHGQNVKRGLTGRGKFALRCSNCHQQTNLPGENMPPGNPSWHLPPPQMPMVFEGRTPGDLCRQLKDPKETGKTLDQLLDHVAEDKLVLWGWNPGDGRTKPPLSHAEFVRSVREWIDHGAACPE